MVGGPQSLLSLSVAFQTSGEPFGPSMCTWCDVQPYHRHEVRGPVIMTDIPTKGTCYVNRKLIDTVRLCVLTPNVHR